MKRNRAWGENLSHRIEALAATPAKEPLPADAQSAFEALLQALEAGEVRAAEQSKDGSWHAVQWVKRGILLGFRLGHLVEMSVPQDPVPGHGLQFFD